MVAKAGVNAHHDMLYFCSSTGRMPFSGQASRNRRAEIARTSRSHIPQCTAVRRELASRRDTSQQEAAGWEKQQKQQFLQLVETRGRKRRVWDDSKGELVDASARFSEDESYRGNLIEFGKGFLLPRGYPESVSDDYLAYQLWAFPCHICGWMSHSLATSSLLKAVGVDPGAAGTAGATAAVKWITKDGIGALGRLLVGGKLGPVFDEDPKRWRMLSEALASGGMALELATAFAPHQAFLLLAGAGNLALAAGKGMGKPAFRIIQTHFAAANNNGDVAAKEEVWEVGAQLLGLAGSIAILNAVQASGNPYNVLWAWAVCQGGHVGLRYMALASLRLRSLNHKRAGLLVAAHVAGRPLPGPAEVGEAEGRIIWLPPSMVSPRLEFGRPLEDLLRWAPLHNPGSTQDVPCTDGCNQTFSHESDTDAASSSGSSDANIGIGNRSRAIGVNGSSPFGLERGDHGSDGGNGSDINISGDSASSSSSSTNFRSSSAVDGGGGDGCYSNTDGADPSVWVSHIRAAGVIGGNSGDDGQSDSQTASAAAQLVEVYRDAGYLLTWQDGRGMAVLREGSQPSVALQALWQAAHLEATGVATASLQQLASSLEAATSALPELLAGAQAARWNTNDMPIRIGPCRYDIA
mmetsp:Transcript_2506/g.7550  ORF Transcript_2506/g.7550 Transcript_2506/m.7550 type:complete len:636 (-) Transcript_2506:730-2637(-)